MYVSVLQKVYTVPGTDHTFYSMGTRVLSRVIKRPERDVAYLHPSFVQVKNLWSYTSDTPTGLRGWSGKSLPLLVRAPKMIWDPCSIPSRSRDFFFSVLRIVHTPHILHRVSTGGDLVTETETVYSNLVQKLRISISIPPFSPHTS